MLNQQIDLVEIAEKPEWKQMIVDIVQKEKMDPWNINLSEMTSNFLNKVKNKKKLNLKISANVMLAASILLRYKSDSFSLHKKQDEMLEGTVFIPDEIYKEDKIPELEAMVRNTTRKVTLNELIGAVEDIITKEKKKSEKERVKIEKEVPKTLLDIAMASPENFEKELKRTYKRIKKEANGEDLALFSNLLEKKSTDGVISLLLPILHLANKGKIGIWQEEVFGEIFINILDEKNN